MNDSLHNPPEPHRLDYQMVRSLQHNGSPALFTPAIFLILSIVALSIAIRIHNGAYDERAIPYLAAAIALPLIALALSHRERDTFAWALAGSGVISISVLTYGLFAFSLLKNLSFNAVQLNLFELSAVAFIIVILPVKLARLFFPLWIVSFVFSGMSVLQATPNPFIDVVQVTRESCLAFAQGHNPYSITYKDIYNGHPELDRAFIPADMLINGRVNAGYPYLPVSFYFSFVADRLAHDYRVANLACMVGASALLAYLRRSREAILAAVLYLLVPSIYLVLEMGWSDPIVVFCLAVVVFCSLRYPRLLPYAVGLLLASKQYMIIIAPATLLLIPQPWNRRSVVPYAARVIATVAIVSLPLILWDMPAFWRSAVAVQFKAAFRPDALNFAAWWVARGHTPPPGWMSYASAMLALAICLWRAPRNASGFCLSMAIIFLAMFSLARQAFCNYYFMIMGALCCSLAAWDTPSKPLPPVLRAPDLH